MSENLVNPRTIRIWLLSPFFYPEAISTGKYNTYLAEALVASGAKVEVLTSHPLFPSWRISPSSKTLPGMSIHRGGACLRYPGSALLRRVVLELWFSLHVLHGWWRLRLRRRIDAKQGVSQMVVPIFPPSLFFSLLAILLPPTVRRVGIVHDLQGVYASRNGGFHRLIGLLIYAVERRAFIACDKLIFLSSSMAQHAIDTYKLPRSFCHVSHPFVAMPKAASSTPFVDKAMPKGLLHVVYSGALGDKQEPDRLLSFMAALQARMPLIHCHIFSNGPHVERLRHHANHLGVPIHDLVPPEELTELYARSTVQIIPQAFGTGKGSLPSKLPNLLSSGVPVFVICDPGSELGELVTTLQAGVVANQWDIDALVDTFLEAFPKLQAETHPERQSRLQPHVDSHFGLVNIVQQVLSF